MNGAKFPTQTIYPIELTTQSCIFCIASHITFSYAMRFIMNIEYKIKKNDGFDIFYETLFHYKYYLSWKKPSLTIEDVEGKTYSC